MINGHTVVDAHHHYIPGELLHNLEDYLPREVTTGKRVSESLFGGTGSSS